MNVEIGTGRPIPRKGIHKWDLLYVEVQTGKIPYRNRKASKERVGKKDECWQYVYASISMRSCRRFVSRVPPPLVREGPSPPYPSSVLYCSSTVSPCILCTGGS